MTLLLLPPRNDIFINIINKKDANFKIKQGQIKVIIKIMIMEPTVSCIGFGWWLKHFEYSLLAYSYKHALGSKAKANVDVGQGLGSKAKANIDGGSRLGKQGRD